MEKRNKKLIIFIIVASLTLLLVASSVFFSAQNFTAYCYNATDSGMDVKVSTFVKSELQNTNIFVINEQKLTHKLEKEYPSIKVVNVERIFPNSVKINYKIIKPYVSVTKNGITYYLSSDSKVLQSDSGELASQKQFITLKTDEIGSGNEYFYNLDGDTVKYLSSSISVLERMGFKDATQIIDEIDFTSLSVSVLQIKTVSGAQIKVLYPNTDFDKKLNLVISAFFANDEAKRTTGVWTVSQTSASWSNN